MAMQNGQYDPDALRHHPDRSMLTRSLGDRLPLPSYFVDTGRQELKDGDVLLLCSDGVWEPLSLQEMLEIINQNEDLNSAVQRILEKVLERGAPDNATVLIIKVKEQQPIYTFKISEKGGEGNVEYSD
jgi:protein phosphatase